jgi:hypothetical protein
MKTFVLIQGTTGLQGQIWHTAQVSGEGKERIQPVFRYELTAQECDYLDKGLIDLNYFIGRYDEAQNRLL